MKKFLNKMNILSKYKSHLLIILFCCFVLIFIDPSYSADSLRYVYSGKQFLEIFFTSVADPIISSDLVNIENANFHKSNNYHYPKREFFTIIPNLIFYFFSLISENGLNYIIFLNLTLFCSLFYKLNNFYNINNNFKYFFIISFFFFGHYQVAGWNIKILPEIIYFFFTLNLIFILINTKKSTFLEITLISFLALSCFLIKPQGIIYLIAIFFIITCKKLFFKDLSKIFVILFILSCFTIPGIIYLDISNIVDVPIISTRNTAMYDGAIISGWINYIEGNLILFEARFDDKKLLLSYGLNYEQKLDYIEICKIIFYRMFYYLIPIRHYDSMFINFWNVVYFFSLYFFSFKYFRKSKNLLKKNIFLFLFMGTLFFHVLVPVTGTFRYQLSLITLMIIISFEFLKLKQNEI